MQEWNERFSERGARLVVRPGNSSNLPPQQACSPSNEEVEDDEHSIVIQINPPEDEPPEAAPMPLTTDAENDEPQQSEFPVIR